MIIVVGPLCLVSYWIQLPTMLLPTFFPKGLSYLLLLFISTPTHTVYRPTFCCSDKPQIDVTAHHPAERREIHYITLQQLTATADACTCL